MIPPVAWVLANPLKAGSVLLIVLLVSALGIRSCQLKQERKQREVAEHNATVAISARTADAAASQVQEQRRDERESRARETQEKVDEAIEAHGDHPVGAVQQSYFDELRRQQAARGGEAAGRAVGVP